MNHEREASEATYYHSNRFCLLVPALEDLKTRSCGFCGEFARRILPLPNPTSAGDKPLPLHSHRPHYICQSPPLWIPAFAGMTGTAGSDSAPIIVPIGHGVRVDGVRICRNLNL